MHLFRTRHGQLCPARFRTGSWPVALGAFVPLLHGYRMQAQAQPNAPATVASGAVGGEVVSTSGAIVQGANVSLRSRSSQEGRQTTTDADGQYRFAAIPAGDFTLAVTLTGFVPIVQDITVAPGEQLTVPPAVLALETVSINVDAITPEQAALEQLHTEEHQRLAGVLPNFYVSYNWIAPPMTARQKYTLATHNVLDPGNLALVGVTAGVQQAANAFPGYHQGAAGYGKRYGADLANLVVGSYMGGAVLPSLFHQDPRYFYKGSGTRRSRFFYAVSRAVVTRGDNGHAQPNLSSVLGDLSAGALSNLYYPASDREGAKLFLENGLLGIAGDAMNNVVQEFLLNHLTTRGSKSQTKGAAP